MIARTTLVTTPKKFLQAVQEKNKRLSLSSANTDQQEQTCPSKLSTAQNHKGISTTTTTAVFPMIRFSAKFFFNSNRALWTPLMPHQLWAPVPHPQVRSQIHLAPIPPNQNLNDLRPPGDPIRATRTAGARRAAGVLPTAAACGGSARRPAPCRPRHPPSTRPGQC